MRLLRFDVVTLFPELFAPFMAVGVARRAFDSGRIVLNCWNPRDFAEGNYRRVDDVSGATIMGDGRVALILDVGSLVPRSRH